MKIKYTILLIIIISLPISYYFASIYTVSLDEWFGFPIVGPVHKTYWKLVPFMLLPSLIVSYMFINNYFIIKKIILTSFILLNT